MGDATAETDADEGAGEPIEEVDTGDTATAAAAAVISAASAACAASTACTTASSFWREISEEKKATRNHNREVLQKPEWSERPVRAHCSVQTTGENMLPNTRPTR